MKMNSLGCILALLFCGLFTAAEGTNLQISYLESDETDFYVLDTEHAELLSHAELSQFHSSGTLNNVLEGFGDQGTYFKEISAIDQWQVHDLWMSQVGRVWSDERGAIVYDQDGNVLEKVLSKSDEVHRFSELDQISFFGEIWNDDFFAARVDDLIENGFVVVDGADVLRAEKEGVLVTFNKVLETFTRIERDDSEQITLEEYVKFIRLPGQRRFPTLTRTIQWFLSEAGLRVCKETRQKRFNIAYDGRKIEDLENVERNIGLALSFDREGEFLRVDGIVLDGHEPNNFELQIRTLGGDLLYRLAHCLGTNISLEAFNAVRTGMLQIQVIAGETNEVLLQKVTHPLTFGRL